MVGSLPGESSHNGSSESTPAKCSVDKQGWYFTRKEIEEFSPSRRDGIDLKKEAYLRKSYCTYLQDLGMRLKVPQVTIATAVIFCHRFFIRQSHAKNDRRTIATVCMFLAGKVEETPRPLKDVIMVSYEIINKKEPDAAHRIKQKDIYEQQKELILVGERVVLATLGFDLNVHHPYKPLVEAIKKFKVAQNALAQVAWNFVNDGLRTSLCLQFKPHHIAAGAIFLAAKFLKVKLPSDGDKVWWQEFDVTPRQLEEVSNQMLELYEQNRMPAAQGSEVEGGSAGGGGSSLRPTVKTEEQVSSQVKTEEHSLADHHGNQSTDMGSVVTHQKADQDNDDCKENVRDSSTRSQYAVGGNLEKSGLKDEPRESPQLGKIDKNKLKAKREKIRKERAEATLKKEVMDEDDLIERELEDGVELAVKNENSEEGEMLNNTSPATNSHKRKGSPLDRHENNGYGDKEHKRHAQENHS
ncbi:hypothetical protein ACFE04_030154 [Oxalis oulophora]